MVIPFYPSLFSPSEEEDDSAAGGAGAGAHRWEETKRLLAANPQIINMDLLLSVLKQQPPAYMVEFILSQHHHHNYHYPPLDLVPKQGPTPLQLAVTEGCDIKVIELLIQACPWALCVTNAEAPEDPLSLAKRLGKQQDLQELLQRPLVEWLVEEKKESSQSSFRYTNKPKLHNQSFIHHQEEQEEDLANVKLLCARLLKRNQQLSKEIKLCQSTIQSMIQQSKILEEVNPKASISTTTTITDDNDNDDDDNTAETRIDELEIRLEEEAALNQLVRNDLVEWKQDMEEQLMFHKKQESHFQQQRQAQQQQYKNDDENDPPPTTTRSENKKQHRSRTLSDHRPKRKSVCRPFNSIM